MPAFPLKGEIFLS